MIKHSRQKSPETNQYFNKVRFISFSALSPPSREIVLNHRNMINTDHLQVYCFSVPSRWYKGRTAVMKEDSDSGTESDYPCVECLLERSGFCLSQGQFPLPPSVKGYQKSAYNEWCAWQVNVFLICTILKENVVDIFPLVLLSVMFISNTHKNSRVQKPIKLSWKVCLSILLYSLILCDSPPFYS